ncbi:hypothetical protein LTR17_006754 [Elasticomyces elasticus]|nr:hypothetical protein LTR17_006754 [Elasticomyces elasticus]
MFRGSPTVSRGRVSFELPTQFLFSKLFSANCGSNEIKAMISEFAEPEEDEPRVYGSIDLEIEPCFFPPCGHVMTVCSMDSWMDFDEYFEVDDEVGDIHGVKMPLAPFSISELKGCPTCRGSLRSLARYGRIVKRAMLDNSAKKLTTWSNKTNIDVAERLATDQEQLMTTVDSMFKPTQDVKLHGQESDQHRAVKTSWSSQRYRMIYSTRNQIQTFAEKICKEEEPYRRLRELMETSQRQNADTNIAQDTELQLRERLQTTSLLVRCDLIIFSDVIRMHNRIAPGTQRGILKINFAANRARCDALVKEAQGTVSVRQEVEGRLFWARFAAMECGVVDSTNGEVSPDAVKHNQEMIDMAMERLSEAEQVCKRFTNNIANPIQGLREEILEVRRILSESVSTSESRMLVVAMAHGSLETGTWRSCKNGHPFTVGRSVKLSDIAHCPACSAENAGRNDETEDDETEDEETESDETEDDETEDDAESVGDMDVKLGDTHL